MNQLTVMWEIPSSNSVCQENTYLRFVCFYGLASCIKCSEVTLYFTVNWNINAWFSIFQWSRCHSFKTCISNKFVHKFFNVQLLNRNQHIDLERSFPSNLKMASTFPVSKIQEPNTLRSSLGHWSWPWAIPSLQREKRDCDKPTLHRTLLRHYCHHHGQWIFITINFQ